MALPLKAGGPPPIPGLPSKTDMGLGLADLPAPRRTSSLGDAGSKPAPRSGLAHADDADLLAPRGMVKPPSPSGTFDIELGPPGPDLSADLPAPKMGRGLGPDVADLPAPRAPRPGAADLPAPKRPVHPSVPPPFELGMPGAPPGGIVDLPMPKGPGGRPVEVPLGPAGITDLPAPKGFFEDLPQPAAHQPGSSDIAPKGFFEDLPQRAQQHQQTRGSEIAPKGFFEDLPGKQNQSRPAKPELPAPKGFFEDLPGRPNVSKPEVPAPKGFFEDLPGKPNTARPEVPAPKGFFDDLPGKPNTAKPEVPAPKGFFEDLPGKPSGGPRTEAVAPKGFFDDLPQPNRPQKPSQPPSNKPVELQMDADANGPELDLNLEEPAPTGGNNQYNDVDLARPTAQAGMRIQTPTRPPPMQPNQAAAAASQKLAPLGDLALELEEPRVGPTTSQRLAPKRTKSAVEKKPGRSRTILLAVLLVVALGAGGFFAYQRFFNKKTVDVEGDLATARSAIVASDLAHWDRAGASAGRVLQSDKTHGEALAIFAEANCAGGLATGINAAGKFGACAQAITTATAETTGANPRLDRAKALNSIIRAGTEPAAVDTLKRLATAEPKDAALQLYLGWAYTARPDFAEAIKAFDQAEKSGAEGIKILAIYGRAQAKLAQLDLAGARADFDLVYQADKTHIGAQVGLAAALPLSQSQQQEEDLRAILERKDLATADPRAVRLAWTLAGEAAKRGNRLDAARERFRKAIELSNDDVRALSGLAETEMLDGKLDTAAVEITKALAISKDDIRAQLVQSDLSIRQKNLRDAEARLDTLAARTPPPGVLDQARIKLIYGRLYEARGEDEDAVKSYEAAAKLAGEADLAPTLAAVNKLTQLADKAAGLKDLERAADLRARADALLANLAANAEKDPQLALTLGMAYLQASDPAKAEPWLYKVVETRPNDPEGQFQLAKAFARLGKLDDAINRLKKAADLAPTRTEIGIEIALTYEASGDVETASKTYSELLAKTPNPSVELRARAGRFFAKRGEIQKAAEQGEKILESDKNHAVGLYLKGEGLLAADKPDEARTHFNKTLEVERAPQYVDALGRASEAQAIKEKDGRFIDSAIKAYVEAHEGDPKLLNPPYSLGRIYVSRREHAKAFPPLAAAWKLDPPKEIKADIGFLIAISAQETGDKAGAINWFKASTNLVPNGEASWHLGMLYKDINAGKESAASFDVATKMGLVLEQSGKKVPWLTDALFWAGRVHLDNNNLPGAKRAWEQYIVRDVPPKDAALLKEARRHLATTLRGTP